MGMMIAARTFELARGRAIHYKSVGGKKVKILRKWCNQGCLKNVPAHLNCVNFSCAIQVSFNLKEDFVVMFCSGTS